uniref:Protein kinase domain-containing protein n=1 Tax=Lates calcarifer TaxID=8187 RepID=A0A4W6DI68_LATCA
EKNFRHINKLWGEGCFGQVAKCFNLQTEEMVAIKIHKHNNNKSIQNEVEIKMVSLNLSQIRPIIHQLLVAFSALKDMGIMYTDLKPDNVMLVNHEDQPFKIKLIDFGLAIPAHQAEVAVDMWGMDCDYHWVKAILHMLGQTPVEYEIVTGVRPKVSQRFFDMAQNLEDAVRRCPSKRDPIEYEDRMAFLSLLKQCLQVDAEQRISPREALKHTYVTMAHLGNRTSSYVDTAGILMAVSPGRFGWI